MPLDQRPNNNGEDLEAVNVGEGRGLEDASNSESSRVSAQQQERAQLAALSRFKPSSRDVISGFAPHLFNDQRPLHRRGSRSRRRRQTSSTECLRRSVSPAPHTSPLRLPAVISVDEHGAIIQPQGEEAVILEVYTASSPPSLLPPPPVIFKATPVLISSPNQNNKPHRQISLFRIDRVLRTLVFRNRRK